MLKSQVVRSSVDDDTAIVSIRLRNDEGSVIIVSMSVADANQLSTAIHSICDRPWSDGLSAELRTGKLVWSKGDED